MEWLAWGCVVAFVAVGYVLVSGELFMLDERKQLSRRARDRFGINVRNLPDTVGKAVLVACGVVGGLAFSYAPPLPPGAQPGQEVEVVLGCSPVVRRGMPTVGEQNIAQARCYFVTLLASIAPQCEPVPDTETEERKRHAEGACRRQLAELGIYGVALFSVGFLVGSGRR